MPWHYGMSLFGDHDSDDVQVFANRPSRGKRSKVKAGRKAARRNRR